MNAIEAYHELCCYTLAHSAPEFIHQHVVDAFAAQTADERTKPIQLTFALVGLSLQLERKFSGKQVQQAHQKLARQKGGWPSFALPRDRGLMTAMNVMAAAPGRDRDEVIHEWCACVWAAYRESHTAVASLLRENLSVK